MSKPSQNSTYKRLTEKYVSFISNYFPAVLIFYIIISLYLIYHASLIHINGSLYKLFPESFQSLKNIKKMEKYHGGEGVLFISARYNNPDHIYSYLINLESNTSSVVESIAQMPDQNSTVLISSTQKLINEYKNSLNQLQNISFQENIKFSKLFVKELSTIILPDTFEKWTAFQKKPNQENRELLYNTLNENLRAIHLYQDAVGKKFLPEQEKVMKAIMKKIAQKLSTEEAKKYIFSLEYKYNSSFIEDHILYFLDIPDLLHLRDTVQKKIDYERRKEILGSHLLVDENLDFDFLKDKYMKRDGGSVTFIKIDENKPFAEIGLNTSNNQFYIRNNMSQNMIAMIIHPTFGSSNITFDEKLFYYLNDVIKNVQQEHPEFHNFQILPSGRYVERFLDTLSLSSDFKIITPIAIIIVILIIWIYFRELRAIPIVCLPLLSGMLWAIGLAELTIGYFNIITSFLIAIITGLGVNFGTHLYSRYREERITGKNTQEALSIVLQTTFISNVTATLTTAAGFLVLTFSDFKGFNQFGLIAGLGMLCLLAGIIIVFPTTVIVTEKINPSHWYLNKQSYQKFTLYKGKAFPFSKFILIISIITIIYSIINAHKLNFNADFSKLIKRNQFYHSSHDTKLEVKQMIGRLTDPVPIYAKNYDTMKRIHQYLVENHDKDNAYNEYKVESIITYNPPQQLQKQKIIQEIHQLLLKEILKNVKSDKDKQNITQLKKLSIAKPIQLKDVPDDLCKSFASSDGGYFVLYHPTLHLESRDSIYAFNHFITQLRDNFKNEDVLVASDILLFKDVLVTITKEAPYIVIFVILAFITMLWIDFRSFKLVLLALLPLIVGLLWLLLIYTQFDLALNYFNVLMFPVIAGLGIDYGVHFLHRYQEEGDENILYVVATTGKAIWIAAFQDMIGFSTLLLALYRGLFTIGQLLAFGVVCCMLASTTFLPALLQLLVYNKQKKLKEKKDIS